VSAEWRGGGRLSTCSKNKKINKKGIGNVSHILEDSVFIIIIFFGGGGGFLYLKKQIK
jgi:hypothetical protein